MFTERFDSFEQANPYMDEVLKTAKFIRCLQSCDLNVRG
ncbi:uncharacterized protein RSE6_14332 [Rhynchosporium secalis]|uniref:Uncharacterized protein n=1 Tax=Rhynchosporium secalis TaxID=38038 RepID=A0A1E1MV15_RHYSE|nr:uncharacterized protein RSE6_14332 [Rhynchosporium secalis]